MNCLHIFDETFHVFIVIPTLFLDKKLEDSLNEDITESITELEYIDPERAEQPKNHPLTIRDRAIRNYDEHHQINYGRN